MNSINHIAIIMDGNGRWGLKNKKSRNAGHKEGLKTVEKIIKESLKKNYLFKLLEFYLVDKIENFNEQKIRLKVLGFRKFTNKLNFLLNDSEKKTANNKRLQVNLALNYGSKLELVNAFKILKKKGDKINIKNINKNLLTNNIPDPDILIRTGNTKRLSNFLLWQLAYSEIYFEKKLWPDFNEKDYTKIINNFKKTRRNFGNI